jgi:hypothetical protein
MAQPTSDKKGQLVEKTKDAMGLLSPHQRLAELTELLQQECNRIITKYSEFLPNSKPTISMVLSLIASKSDVCCVDYSLRNRQWSFVDPYYINRHALAVGVLMDAVYDGLTNLQYEVCIGSEVQMTFGKLDALITKNGGELEALYGNCKIGIEIKTGNSLDLAQLFRYLIDIDSLILVRIKSKQIVTLRKYQFLETLSLLLETWISRTQRLLAKNDLRCNHWKGRMRSQVLRSDVLERDIVSFANGLNTIRADVVDSVMQELDRMKALSLGGCTE